MEDKEYKLPLGLCRQAVMKLESFVTDMREAAEEDGIDPEDKEEFERQAEVAGTMIARIVNMVSKEIGEEEFLNEQPEMDVIDPYPGTEEDLGEESIDVE